MEGHQSKGEVTLTETSAEVGGIGPLAQIKPRYHAIALAMMLTVKKTQCCALPSETRRGGREPGPVP